MNDQWLLSNLRYIRDGERVRSGGICDNLYRLAGGRFVPPEWLGRHMDVLRALWVDWPHYSGDLLYPVPGTGCLGPKGSYLSRDLWSKRSKYGRLRWDLLNYLISKLETNGT